MVSKHHALRFQHLSCVCIVVRAGVHDLLCCMRKQLLLVSLRYIHSEVLFFFPDLILFPLFFVECRYTALWRRGWHRWGEQDHLAYTWQSFPSLSMSVGGRLTPPGRRSVDEGGRREEVRGCFSVMDGALDAGGGWCCLGTGLRREIQKRRRVVDDG